MTRTGNGRRLAWRTLAGFWAVVLAVLAGGGAVLAFLGPPATETASPALSAGAPGPAAPVLPQESHREASSAAPAHAQPAPPPPAEEAEAGDPAPHPIAPAAVAPRPPGAPIATADPALLEPAPHYPGSFLPRIGPDGRRPMDVYAAGRPP
ncbi:MAG TPA: hypothetical protein VGC80_12265, partial [Acetobacteraceae bacterium]